ncbi:MAG: sigma 54-interacting transcriptional regulator [Myxococcota bacterium]
MSELCFPSQMGRADTQSLSILDERVRRRDETVIAPELVFLLRADRPTTPSCRIGLVGVKRVRLGRASGGEVVIDRSDGGVEVRLPDPRMSSRHFEIEIDGATARFRDLGSKNGSRVDGERLGEGALADGALVELGRSFLLFRIGGPVFADADPRPRQLSRPELSTFSPPLAATWAAISDVASTSMSIALEGPLASGREVVARAIHELSGRKGAFEVLDGRGRPEAFDETVAAVVERAARGTLFLADIGTLPESWQLGLLRVLRAGGAEAEANGAPRLVVSATEDLHRLIEAGTLRSDFVARLEGARFRLPSLAERRSDLGLMLQVALTKLVADPGVVQFRRRAVRALFQHSWPTNGQRGWRTPWRLVSPAPKRLRWLWRIFQIA